MDNVVKEKSYLFAKRIVLMCRFLRETQHEYIMTKQLLRCGSSIGANVAESKYAQSRPDFVTKLSIALKEAGETNFWLHLLHDTGYLTERQFASIIGDCEELERLLVSIVKTTKENS